MNRIFKLSESYNEKLRDFFNEKSGEAFKGLSEMERKFIIEIYISNPLISIETAELFNEQATQSFHHLVSPISLYENYIDLFGDMLYSKIKESVEKKFYELHAIVLERFKRKLNG